MANVAFYEKVKIIYGPGSVRQTGALLKECGYKKALVVYDAGVAGLLGGLLDSLKAEGIACVLFDKVLPPPPPPTVAEGSALCNSEQCDAVVALGGGSAIDTAKGINILRFNEGPILRFGAPGTEMTDSPGLICIPTTAGTGSESSDGLIITDTETGVKVPILALNGMSEYAIIDPELMAGMPPALTACTGLDALCHACESYTTVRANKLTGLLLEKMIETIVAALPAAVSDGTNMEARENMAIASCLGGCMLANNGTHAGHSFAHVLGARYHIPHGLACAYAEPFILEYNAVALPEKTRRIGELLGGVFTGRESPAETGAVARDALIAFRSQLGVPAISSFIQGSVDCGALADAILAEPFMGLNPRQIPREDVLSLLEKVLAQ